MKHTKLSTLLASLAFGALVSSTQAQVIFEDDFEAGNLNKWTTTGSFPLDIQAGTNNIPTGGNYSAFLSEAMDRMHAEFAGGGTSSSKFTYYMYDNPAAAPRVYAEIRNHGGGTITGALTQLLAIGRYNSVTYPGDVWSSGHYQGRIVFPSALGGWFNLNAVGAPGRSTGWHKFDIEAGLNSDGTYSIKYFVDNVLSRDFRGAFNNTLPWNVAVMGAGLSGTGNNWFDGFKVVNGQPHISQDPASQTVNVGQNLNITAQVVGNPTLTYQWRKNGTNIVGATAIPLVINNAQISDSGTYSLVASNSLGTATSTNAIITVSPLIVIAKTPAEVHINNGESVTFSVVSDITGNSPAVYQWRKDGVNIPGATQSSYTIASVQVADTGSYTVWDGTTASSGSNAEQLNVNAAPVITAQNQTVPPNTTFRYVLPVTDDYSVQATPFETFDTRQSGATRIMFNNPNFSGATLPNINTNEVMLGVVTNAIPAGNGSANAFLAKFHYSDLSSWPWVRLTTASGGGGVTNRQNPVVSFVQPLRFDVHSNRRVGVAIGLRETNTQNPIGGNGGTSGSIEFIDVIDNSPNPNQFVDAGVWTTLQFNPATAQAAPYPGSGNGVLASTTGKGALEHVALLWNDFSEVQYDYEIYLDNFVVVPTNGLTFSLDSAPSGATIDPVTGAISWVAPASLGTTETFFVRVTDTLGLDSTSSFTVTVSDVVPEPGSLSISRSGSNIIITWDGNFVLQSADTITGSWSDTAITSGQAIPATAASKFYRLRN